MVIRVPPYLKETTVNGENNKGGNEFNITEYETFVIPLDIGEIVVYAGFLLTH